MRAGFASSHFVLKHSLGAPDESPAPSEQRGRSPSLGLTGGFLLAMCRSVGHSDPATHGRVTPLGLALPPLCHGCSGRETLLLCPALTQHIASHRTAVRFADLQPRVASHHSCSRSAWQPYQQCGLDVITALPSTRYFLSVVCHLRACLQTPAHTGALTPALLLPLQCFFVLTPSEHQ